MKITPVSNYTENIVFLRWQMSRLGFSGNLEMCPHNNCFKVLNLNEAQLRHHPEISWCCDHAGPHQEIRAPSGWRHIEKLSLTKEVLVQSRRQKVQTSSRPLQVGKVNGFKVLPRSDFRGPLHPSMLTILSRCIVESLRTWGRATSRYGKHHRGWSAWASALLAASHPGYLHFENRLHDVHSVIQDPPPNHTDCCPCHDACLHTHKKKLERGFQTQAHKRTMLSMHLNLHGRFLPALPMCLSSTSIPQVHTAVPLFFADSIVPGLHLSLTHPLVPMLYRAK